MVVVGCVYYLVDKKKFQIKIEDGNSKETNNGSLTLIFS